jgi:hypothetical protein
LFRFGCGNNLRGMSRYGPPGCAPAYLAGMLQAMVADGVLLLVSKTPAE